MKKLLSIFLVALSVLTMFLSSCGQKKEKILVLYYSQSNTTKTLALEFQNQLGADIQEITCVNGYDGDFKQTIDRWQKELSENIFPEIKPIEKNLKDYDVIFLGYPIWGGTYALPMASFLKNADFSGKKIVPFCTFGSGGLNTSSADLKKNIKNATILDGYGLRQARLSNAKEEVEKFLIKSGFKQGEVEKFDEFSEQKDVSEAEKDVFNQACGDYQMPLGRPVSVGSRNISGGKQYLFTVEGENGSKGQIYVLVKDGQKPEFTEVVR